MNTIYFIGLFLFVSSTTDPYVHAVLPPIPHGVEGHAMVFMYTGTGTFLGDWGTSRKATYQAWNYVEFTTGDHVSFQATPASGNPSVPVELGHLRNPCTKFNQLKGGFSGPNFAAAPAVVDIRYGKLTAVTALSPDQSNYRIDTQLQYDSAGPLVMTVVNNGVVRALILPRGSCGVFAYIPQTALTGSYDGHGEIPHVVAYLGMVDGNSMGLDCWRNDPANTTQINTITIAQTPPGGGACSPIYRPWVPLPRSAAKTPVSAIVGSACPLPFQPMNAPRHCPQIFEFMTADCSNTAWP